MGKIYRGLAQCGLWGCFDEFNRINLDVLSVCAQQVFCVLSAIRERKKQFVFTDGAKVSLDPRVGFFITMNPGYAGRQELPENLKSLFRGVTMMVPDRQIIKKVKLAACGYQQNEFLRQEVFRALRLVRAAALEAAALRLRPAEHPVRVAHDGRVEAREPGQSESVLAMRTLRDMNMSKFVAEDVTLFCPSSTTSSRASKADKATFPDVEAAMAKVATAGPTAAPHVAQQVRAAVRDVPRAARDHARRPDGRGQDGDLRDARRRAHRDGGRSTTSGG